MAIDWDVLAVVDIVVDAVGVVDVVRVVVAKTRKINRSIKF